ncbi:MAG: hypothetical protein WAX69_10770, partial [Victivallales bacterium]
MKKISIILIVMTFSPGVFAQGEQYADAYNCIARALLSRLQLVGIADSSVAEKLHGASVTQENLNGLRNAALKLAKNYYLLQDTPVTPKDKKINSDDINTYLLPALHNNPDFETAMKGIGNGRDKFTKVPGEYVSDGTTIYAENFTDVPVLGIHFEELATLINKLKITRKNMSWTNTNIRYSTADSHYNVIKVSSKKNPNKTFPYTWTGSGENMYKAALDQAREKYNRNTPLDCWLEAKASAPSYEIGYYYTKVVGSGIDTFFNPNAGISITTSQAYAPITAAMSSLKAYGITKNTTNSYKDKVYRSSVIREIFSVNKADGKSEGPSGYYSEFYYYTDGLDDRSDAPPLNPTGEPEENKPCYVRGEWCSAVLVFTASSLKDASVSVPQLKDHGSDGLVDTGCTCTTCKMDLKKDFDALSRCSEVAYPLGAGNGNIDGLKIRSYVSEQTLPWGRIQVYSLHTRVFPPCVGSEITKDTSGNIIKESSWKFVEVLRPSAATVVFNLLDGRPLNNKDYRISKIDGEDSYEIKFPDSEGAIYHKFSLDTNLGYYPVVQCRKVAKDSTLTTNSSGIGQWNGITTVYRSVVGGKISYVQWALGKSYPVYFADLVDSVSYRDVVGSKVMQTAESKRTVSGGKTCTSYYMKDAAGKLESQTDIVVNPAENSTSVSDYAINGGKASTVARIVKTVHSTDTTGNLVCTVTTTAGTQFCTEKTVYAPFSWGYEPVDNILSAGTAAAKRTQYSYYADPAQAGYGKLKSSSFPDGSWENLEYDPSGRLTARITPFVNSGSGADPLLSRVVAYSYTANAPGDILETDDRRPRTIVENVKGVEISRSYSVYLSGQSYSVRAAAPNATWNAAGNLSTVTETYVDGAFKGRTRKIANPDGTITVYIYSPIVSGVLTTTVESGSGSGYLVSDGTRSVTVTDAAGNTSSSKIYDIKSGDMTSSATYTRDAFGRATRVDYMDGTHTETIYGCCGPESETDREGIVTITAYDALKRVTFTTRVGMTTLYGYDVFGNVTSTTRKGTDGSECTTSSFYSVSGDLLSTTDTMLNKTSYSQDYSARIRTTTNPDGSTSVLEYNFDGSTAGISGTAVHGVSYSYSVAGGEMCTKTWPTGFQDQWTKSYTDFLGRRYRTEYADSTESVTSYDVKGRPEKQAFAGHTTFSSYNDKGELIKQVVDLNGNGLSDANDRITEYSNIVTGTVRRQIVTVNGVKVSETDTSLDGLSSKQTLFDRSQSTSTSTTMPTAANGFKRTVVVSNPDGSTVTQTYHDGKLMSSAHSILGTTTYIYDAHSRLSSQLTTVDGRPMTVSYAYDKNDRTIQTTDSGSRITSYSYDSMGRMTKTTLPDGRSVNYSFLQTGELSGVSGADTYPVTYTFDGMGRMKTLKDGNNSTTTWGYDPLRGFMTSKTYADGARSAFSYNPDGSVKTRTWARGIVTNYTYNAAGELLGVTYADDGRPTTGNISFTRDCFGRPTDITDATGSRTLAYNNDSTISSETIPNIANHGVSYGYDAIGRRNSMSLQNRGTSLSTVNYTYDAMSRLSSVGSAGILPAVTASYSRISGSSLLSTSTVGNLTTTRTYDSLNRLTSVGTAGTLPAASASFSYTYNISDRRSKTTFSDNSNWQYGYDDKGQITSAVKRSAEGTIQQKFGYAFDSIGNRTKSSVGVPARDSFYFPNSLNQYTQRTVPGVVEISGEADASAKIAIQRMSLGFAEAAYAKDATRTGRFFSRLFTLDNSQGPVSEKFKIYAVNAAGASVATQTTDAFLPRTPEDFSYDPDGNLTQDGRMSYSWDAENRLISVSSLSSLSSRIKDECAYDYTSRRTSKKVYSWSSTTNDWQLTTDNRFVWNGWQLVGIFNASNQLVRSYCWGEDGLISD